MLAEGRIGPPDKKVLDCKLQHKEKEHEHKLGQLLHLISPSFEGHQAVHDKSKSCAMQPSLKVSKLNGCMQSGCRRSTTATTGAVLQVLRLNIASLLSIGSKQIMRQDFIVWHH
jgi:hypothetical protein